MPAYPEGRVTGLITIDGDPAPKGAITFSPTAGASGPVVGTSVLDGRYRCEHVPIGKLNATFTLQAAEPRKFVDATGVERSVPQDILPPAYREGIAVEVEAGENVRDFALESSSAAP